MNIRGAEHLTPTQLLELLSSGEGRLVTFEYCVSLIVVSLRAPSRVHLLRKGQFGALVSLPYTLLTFFLGWWGLPWGVVYTPLVLVGNLSGGCDVTAQFWPELCAAAQAGSRESVS